jgi:glycosyltransferase involved in cell wall biosynthesis
MRNCRLRILYVAYSMLPVTRTSCGGAEQVLWHLEAEMARRGHDTVVAACDGSQISGTLFATGASPRQPDRFEQRDAEHAAQILALLERSQRSDAPFDLVHDQSGSFWRHAPAVNSPVLATLHLPRSFYSEEPFALGAENVFFNCVSDSQRREFSASPRMLGVVRNGIRLQEFLPPSTLRGDYLLWIGRICEEKGAHIAIEVARRARHRLVIAGDVYPFSYHQAYFDREIRPHLEARSATVSYVRKPDMSRKIELFRRAKALLLPSLVNETSSLVAMEAMACGTPVLAFRRGALPEVVADGATGFLVNTPEEMTAALQLINEIDPRVCRAHVGNNFAAARMAADYERLYRALTSAPAGDLHLRTVA